MISVKIVFFATLKELTGVRNINLDIPENSTIMGLKKILCEAYPAVEGSLGTSIVALNHEYGSDTDSLKMDDEVAFFPPVSGGSSLHDNDYFLVTKDALDLNVLVNQMTQSSTGAICIFTGVVRGLTTRGISHETDYLEYESYIPMAEVKMRQVAGEIRDRWPSVETIAIIQRIGKLFPGTPTVLIACSAGHRDTGVFDAARYGIDRLKEIVPIWKKEIGPGGESWVEGDYHPEPGE